MLGSIADAATTVTNVTRRVALFRGINVGGHNKIPMAELRDEFAALGYDDIVSIIQSGNVCFSSPDDPATLGSDIRAAVKARFAVDVPVTLRTREEISASLTAHPFPAGPVEPKLHHVVFLAEPAVADAADLIGDHTPADYAVIGREIHVVYPDGSARSKLTVDLIDRRLHTTATARNLPTCEKIATALSAQ